MDPRKKCITRSLREIPTTIHSVKTTTTSCASAEEATAYAAKRGWGQENAGPRWGTGSPRLKNAPNQVFSASKKKPEMHPGLAVSCLQPHIAGMWCLRCKSPRCWVPTTHREKYKEMGKELVMLAEYKLMRRDRSCLNLTRNFQTPSKHMFSSHNPWTEAFNKTTNTAIMKMKTWSVY